MYRSKAEFDEIVGKGLAFSNAVSVVDRNAINLSILTPEVFSLDQLFDRYENEEILILSQN